ncbi:MAG: hypothetical protein WD276_06690 [Actinomycetota bacterium]
MDSTGLITSLVILGVLLIAGGAIYLSIYLKKKRRQELQLMARQLGLRYSQEDPFGLLAYPFALFRKGDGRGLENVLAGKWQELEVKEFDYWYYEESRDSDGNTSRTYYRFSCVATDIDAACPPLTIGRENFFTRMADSLGFRDIEFELGEFNKNFQVKGKDRKFANDLVDARMMQWLLGAGEGWSFEVSGNQVMCFAKRRRPTELIPLFGTLKAFREHVPRVVYELYGSGAAR